MKPNEEYYEFDRAAQLRLLVASLRRDRMDFLHWWTMDNLQEMSYLSVGRANGALDMALTCGVVSKEQGARLRAWVSTWMKRESAKALPAS